MTSALKIERFNGADEDIVELARFGSKSILHFCKAYAPRAFKRPYNKYIHGTIARLLDAPVDYSVDVSQRVIIDLAPRGVGKSAIGTTMDSVRDVVEERIQYMQLASNVAEKAIEHLATVKHQFDTNERLRAVFGDLRGTTWNEQELHFTNGIKIVALGRGKQMRGSRAPDMERPDKIKCDDLESLVTADSKLQTAQIERWLMSDLIAGLNPETGRLVMHATALTPGCIAHRYADLYKATSCRLELFNDAYETRYPEVYSNEWIAQKRTDAIEKGTLNTLWADYRNLPIAAETQRFKQEMFRYYDPLDPAEVAIWMQKERVILCDPAHKDRKTSDPSAIVPVALSYTGEIDVLAWSNRREVGDEYFAHVAEFCVRFNIHEIYVETNGLGDYILNPLRNYLATRGIFAIIHDVHNVVRKTDRMGTLYPHYAAGKVRHPRTGSEEAESQILAFPNAVNDDLHDGLAMVTKVQTDKFMGYPAADDKELNAAYSMNFESVY